MKKFVFKVKLFVFKMKKIVFKVKLFVFKMKIDQSFVIEVQICTNFCVLSHHL